ncbi:MAG: hypothetical protein JW955_01005 [Sedimentisphaerales bacterium]|nr:hypothetical protein [Sedimentisphaerales bacterium]
MTRRARVFFVGMLVLCVLSACGTAEIIQYDDGVWEYQNPPLGGQAVYFTVPLEYGPIWKLETLSIVTIGGPGAGKPITVKVWADDGGSMGDVLFQTDSTVVGNDWHWVDIDISGAGLQWSAGESFFAGFDQATDLNGCWDSTDPDHGRGYRRWSWSSSWESEADDALIRVNGAIVPIPGAALLGVLGLASAGSLLRRRRAL